MKFHDPPKCATESAIRCRASSPRRSPRSGCGSRGRAPVADAACTCRASTVSMSHFPPSALRCSSSNAMSLAVDLQARSLFERHGVGLVRRLLHHRRKPEQLAMPPANLPAPPGCPRRRSSHARSPTASRRHAHPNRRSCRSAAAPANLRSSTSPAQNLQFVVIQQCKQRNMSQLGSHHKPSLTSPMDYKSSFAVRRRCACNFHLIVTRTYPRAQLR